MPAIPIKTKEKILCITDIFKDDGIYPRETIDEARIEFFSELLREGTIFPPIKIAREVTGRYILLDGYHRYSAFKKLEKQDIACHLIETEPHFWRLLAVRFNFDSSKPLQHGEIKRAIQAAWCKDEIRDKRQIADMVGCTVQWVRKVVKAIEEEECADQISQNQKIRVGEAYQVRDILEQSSVAKNDMQPSVKLEPITDETNSPAETAIRNTERIIENFIRFEHAWQPDQKEALFVFEGIKHNLTIDNIADHIKKNPSWIRNTAYALLALYQKEENPAAQITPISETLSTPIERVAFIHWLFLHWPIMLPERKTIFEWLLLNSSQYRDERLIQLTRQEHLYWYNENMRKSVDEHEEKGGQMQVALLDDPLSRLGQISIYFEDLKRYVQKYEIEPHVAKGLLEQMNLILITQNRILHHLRQLV